MNNTTMKLTTFDDLMSNNNQLEELTLEQLESVSGAKEIYWIIGGLALVSPLAAGMVALGYYCNRC